MQYDRRDLSNIFVKQNTTNAVNFSIFEKKPEGKFFKINLQTGLSFTSAYIHPEIIKKNYGDLDFNSTTVKFAIAT